MIHPATPFKKTGSDFTKDLRRIILFTLTILVFTASVCVSSATDVYFAGGEQVSSAVYESSSKTPGGCVLFIIDGLGSVYMYPEKDGEMLDGNLTETASLPQFSALWKKSFRALDVSLLNPVTENGHSTIVTGYSNADSETVGFGRSSVQDICRENGYLCFGVMTRGDFETMRQKFDVIAYDPANTITSAEMEVGRNDRFNRTLDEEAIVDEVEKTLKEHAAEAHSYVKSGTTAEKYDGYNTWGIDTASAVVDVMRKYPDQKYLLVVNIGAIDSTGHNRGYFAYLDALERLDDNLADFTEKCLKCGISFVLTADHGMTFTSADKKGGHSSSKYSKCETSLRIPFIVFSPNVPAAVYEEPAAQKDIGPTVLSILEITDRLRYADGKALPVKRTASLTITGISGRNFTLETATGKTVYESVSAFPEDDQKSHSNSGQNMTVKASEDDVCRIFGLPKGKYVLTYEKNDIFSGTETKDIELTADSDVQIISVSKYGNDSSGKTGNGDGAVGRNSSSGKSSGDSSASSIPAGRMASCLVLLTVVNGGGLLLIRRILRGKPDKNKKDKSKIFKEENKKEENEMEKEECREDENFSISFSGDYD